MVLNDRPEDIRKIKLKKTYVNRELSWLSFNQRVLQEAEDESVPLLERLKFLGIFSSNLDEFYRVRVATYKRMVAKADESGIGDGPQQVLNQIQKKVIKLRDQFDSTFTKVLSLLQDENIYLINENELDELQQKFVQNYFIEKVRPRLVPVMIREKKKFPYLHNQVIYLAIHLSKSDDPEDYQYAVIQLPTNTINRFIEIPSVGEKKCIIMLDDIIRNSLPDIFSIFDYDTFAAYTIKLTRDAEFDINDDITISFFEKIAQSVKAREKGRIVRFVYDKSMPDKMFDFILNKLKIKEEENITPGGKYHNARDFLGFPSLGFKHLLYSKQLPLPHKDLINQKSAFKVIKNKDILLHYPYQSYHHVIDFLREAALDPKVRSIKITLYRLASNSAVINALINAMRNGKRVTVVIELQARFDEEANLYWVNQLKEEGAHILDGVPGLKVHAKLCQVRRREEDGDILYTYISTGNFNESTAKIYADHGLFTAHKDISKEVKKVFDFLENNYKTFAYKHLLVSPFFMRKKIKKMIKNEIKLASEGKEGLIYIKLNNLVDQDMINWLYKASQAGVKIKMIVRGICSLVPGLKDLSENIEVYSILDMYLEHSRIFVFGNGGEEKYYLTSADWMVRNLDNRIEVATPIYDKAIQKEIKEYLTVQFNDSKKARVLNQKQDNSYRSGKNLKGPRAQVGQYEILQQRIIFEG
jgi:polyphosphate kinase